MEGNDVENKNQVLQLIQTIMNQQFGGNQNGTRRMLYTCLFPDGRRYWKVIAFANDQDMRTFRTATDNIKAEVENIHLQRNAEGRSEWNETDRMAFRTWLQHCDQLVHDWGVERIPEDIRSAIQDTQRNFNIVPTEFGEDVGSIPEDQLPALAQIGIWIIHV